MKNVRTRSLATLEYLPEARKKASDDTKSLEMFEADMKSYGL